ncbi:MAG: DUF2059 domain-containing protein [Terricaulis sp.]
MLRACLTVLFVWMGLSASAMAQDAPPPPERVALAREVMMLSGGEQSFLDMMEQMRPIMLQNMRAQGLSEETANRVTELFVQEFQQEAPRMLELGSIAYANKFTDQELIDLAIFLRTPAGRAWVENQTEIAAAMMQAGMLVGQEVAARVLDRVRRQPAPHTP